MPPKIVRFSFALGACLAIAFGLMALTSPGAVEARQMKTGKSAQQGSMSMTGCLQKGVEAGGYYLTDDEGKMWELSSRAVKLAKDVGQKVTVMGREVQRSKAIEAKLESDETKEADGKPHGDFQVASIKSSGEACGK